MVRLVKEMFIIFIGALAFIYLVNPGAGFIEFLPDNLPLVGNIDEAFMTMVLLSVFRHYGFDLSRLLGDGGKSQKTLSPPQQRMLP